MDRPRRQSLSRLRTGPLVREARHHAGLTQAELAARLGTTQSAVSAWERGLETPRVDTLGRILGACGFEADLVFRRRDDVDRSQIRENLLMSPAQRLATVSNVSDFVSKARRAERAPARA